jgi:predicted nuclease with TOPRIM domain
VLRLRERTMFTSADAGAARTLAAGADHDVSEVRAELRAHLSVLHALRETQLEQSQRLDGVDGRLDRMDGRLDGLDGRLDRMDGRFDGLDGRLDRMDGRFDGLDGRLEGVQTGITQTLTLLERLTDED